MGVKADGIPADLVARFPWEEVVGKRLGDRGIVEPIAVMMLGCSAL